MMTMIDDNMFFPYWAGRFCGFISSIANYYDVPKEIKEKALEIVAEFEKALKERV